MRKGKPDKKKIKRKTMPLLQDPINRSLTLLVVIIQANTSLFSLLSTCNASNHICLLFKFCCNQLTPGGNTSTPPSVNCKQSSENERFEFC